MNKPKLYDITIALSAYSTLSVEDLEVRIIAALLEPETDVITLDGQNETFEVLEYYETQVRDAEEEY